MTKHCNVQPSRNLRRDIELSTTLSDNGYDSYATQIKSNLWKDKLKVIGKYALAIILLLGGIAACCLQQYGIGVAGITLGSIVWLNARESRLRLVQNNKLFNFYF